MIFDGLLRRYNHMHLVETIHNYKLKSKHDIVWLSGPLTKPIEIYFHGFLGTRNGMYKQSFVLFAY